MLRRFVFVAAIGALLLGPAAGFAQDQEKWIELLRSDVRNQKTAIVTAAMQLSDAEAQKFWPIYREYEQELALLNDKVLELIKGYAQAYETMDDVKAKDLANRWFKLQDERLSLRKKYFNKVQKDLSSTTAAQWLQLENQLGLVIDIKIAQNLPLLEKGVEKVQGAAER